LTIGKQIPVLHFGAMSGLHRTANIWTCPCEVCESFRQSRGVIGVMNVATSFKPSKPFTPQPIDVVRSGRERLTFEPCD
jgi:hypothetical protein